MSGRLPWPWAAALPAVWSAHIGAMYVLQSLHCLDGVFGGDVFGIPAVRLVSILLTLAALAIAASAGLRMHTLYRAAEDEATEYFSLGSSVVSGMLGVYLLWSLVPALLYPTCPA